MKDPNSFNGSESDWVPSIVNRKVLKLNSTSGLNEVCETAKIELKQVSSFWKECIG